MLTNYYICSYCGKTKTTIGKKSKIPKCNCKGGNGSTFMTKHRKEVYDKWRKNHA